VVKAFRLASREFCSFMRECPKRYVELVKGLKLRKVERVQEVLGDKGWWRSERQRND